ncbi:MAG TPA: methylated-DNA--[protein]-cysteine S-methyltransferase [Vicinamibacteria bacterium]|nr:methylated-DNA--[protein]-cysteine S-methyltransferase [Vicinamibacteria bacterium]
MTSLELASLTSPLGPLVLAVGPRGLVGLDLEGDQAGMVRRLERRFGPLHLARSEDPGGVVATLRRYFAGRLQALDKVEVDPGGTPFQSQVWLALRRIPAGTTWSYARLAQEVGRPAAVRAVGAANGANPVPLVLPCHRVIGSDGRLVGYGGGLDRKEWLLRHEHARFVAERQARLPLVEA